MSPRDCGGICRRQLVFESALLFKTATTTINFFLDQSDSNGGSGGGCCFHLLVRVVRCKADAFERSKMCKLHPYKSEGGQTFSVQCNGEENFAHSVLVCKSHTSVRLRASRPLSIFCNAAAAQPPATLVQPPLPQSDWSRRRVAAAAAQRQVIRFARFGAAHTKLACAAKARAFAPVCVRQSADSGQTQSRRASRRHGKTRAARNCSRRCSRSLLRRVPVVTAAREPRLYHSSA